MLDPYDLENAMMTGGMEGVKQKIEAARQEEEKNKEELVKKAASVVKILEMPEWAIIAEKIEEFKKVFVRMPEDYYQNKDIAGIDAGARAALTMLTNWLKAQNIIIETYANRTNEPRG